MEHLPALLNRLSFVEIWLGYYYHKNIIRKISKFEYARKRLIKRINTLQIQEFNRD